MAAKKKSKAKSTKRKSSRSKKSSNSTLTIIVLIVVIGLGAYYFMTGNDVLGIFTPTEEPPQEGEVTVESPSQPDAPAPVTSVSGDWWEVYFADRHNFGDPENWQGSIQEQIIKKIDAAQTSIHIASFEFNLTPVAEALVAAKERGVDVRWVTDDEHGLEADEEPGHGQFEMLHEAGIEVKGDDRSALMHNKFWIFDSKTVWTGSTNITINGIFKQDNNVIVVHSPEVAAIYEREFEEMWNGEHGIRSPSTVDQQSATVNGTPVQALFAAEDGVIGHLIPYVESAQSSVRFMAFSFTDYPLAEAMINRAKDGVDVAGVFEKVGSETEYAELRTLHCAGVPVRQDGNPTFLHHKLIIVDERIVMTGSLNYSTNAEESNDENVIIVDNPEIAALYMQEFERVWAEGEDPDPADMNCE
jgi:phosphatidylserine/phosphatidylglycerophosphate/cardiolipin synthase-like enzyme